MVHPTGSIGAEGSSAGRVFVEDCVAVSLPDLRRWGVLMANHRRSARLAYVVNGRTLGVLSLVVHAVDDAPSWMRIAWVDDGRTISQEVELACLPQPFGGWRWLIVCPVSGRHCGVLALPPGGMRFASPQAHGLAYASQYEDPFNRCLRRAEKARQRLARLSRYARHPTRGRLLAQMLEGDRLVDEEFHFRFHSRASA